MAASGAFPPPVARKFTPAEQAVLSIIVAEVKEHGDCRLCLDAIAARAGCSRSSVRNAIRRARMLGFVTVEIRPVKGAKNLPNIVRIADAAWRLWIERGSRRAKGQGGGVKDFSPTNTKIKKGTSSGRY